jgi:hypothetical protein
MAGFLALAICANATVGAAQSTGGPNETPTRQGILTKPPKLIEFVEAVYPESEKAAGRTASVILQIAINDKGSRRGRRRFNRPVPTSDAALEAAKKPDSTAEIDNAVSGEKSLTKYEFVFKEEAAGHITTKA